MVAVVGSWQSAADQGHANAQAQLGTLYAKGNGVKQNYGESERRYRQAAEQGVVEAQVSLGVTYDLGQGVKQNYAEAARWYRKAADQGFASAQFNLSMMCAKDQGVKQDDVEAAWWCRKAVEQGHAKAQCAIGEWYFRGKGVKQDFAEAVRWYRKGAEQGYANKVEEYALLAEEELCKQRRYSFLKPDASAAAPVPCARKFANCGIAETADSATLKPCSRCTAVVYCGKACQTQHWKEGGHKQGQEQGRAGCAPGCFFDCTRVPGPCLGAPVLLHPGYPGRARVHLFAAPG